MMSVAYQHVLAKGRQDPEPKRVSYTVCGSKQPAEALVIGLVSLGVLYLPQKSFENDGISSLISRKTQIIMKPIAVIDALPDEALARVE